MPIIYPSYFLFLGDGFGGDVNIYEIRLLDIDLPNLVAVLFLNPLVLLLDFPILLSLDKDSILDCKCTLYSFKSSIGTFWFLIKLTHKLRHKLFVLLIWLSSKMVVPTGWALRLLKCFGRFLRLSSLLWWLSDCLVHGLCRH